MSLHQGDCLQILPTLADNSVDLILSDPPYFKVKNEAWDKQWGKAEQFLAWLDAVATEWRRVLKPNGSLYCFASPQMAARVEVMLSKRFNILNNIIWAKTTGRWSKANKASLRGFFPSSERIIFAEHHGADNIAKSGAGYQTKCDQLRGFVFEPLRAYFESEKVRAKVLNKQIQDWFAAHDLPRYVVARHTFTNSQWAMPTAENYQALRRCFNQLGVGKYLRREYEDLRREYEDLRCEYEDLRRPFSVSPEVPYTDVWQFDPVAFYQGKHPCEKPQDLLSHVINTSTKSDAVVLDSFMGTGSTGVAALANGRRFIGIELNQAYYSTAKARIEHPTPKPLLFPAIPNQSQCSWL